MTDDEEMTVKLPLRSWRAIVDLVESGGIYRTVQPILGSVYAQVNSQIQAARDRDAAEAVQAELRAMAAAAAPPMQSINNGTEEAVDEHVCPSSLH